MTPDNDRMPNPEFLRLMQEATALTRAGDLRAATAAIQQALAGGVPQGEGGAPAPARPQEEVIDVEARWVPEARPLAGPQEEGVGPGSVEGNEVPAAPGVESRAPAQDTAGAGAGAGPGAGPSSQPEAFIAGRWGEGPAARDYKLYIPPAAGAGRPLPLVVMLHGCTQHPDDFAAGTRMNEAARERGLYVLYPAQSAQANPQRCWNWFKHSHQGRDRGEPAILAGMVREIARRHAVDPARIYVAGLSAGGAMAAILGQAYPDLFAAVGVHSGLAAGAARDLPSAHHAMRSGARPAAGQAPRVPTIVLHGDADKTVHPENGQQQFASAAGLGPEHGAAEAGRAPGGRRFTRRVRRDAAGRVVAEYWEVHGAGHAWSGGSPRGSYTDPQGPDATEAMLRFFEGQRRTPAA